MKLIVGLFAGAMFAILVWQLADSPGPKVDPAQSDFAARINTACKTGYEAYDWQIRDEFHTDIPPGMVKVTCIRRGNGGGLDQYPVAVPR